MLISSKPATLSPADIQKIEWLKCWLDAHFLEQLTLRKLCRLCLLNEFKLKKGFREIHGTSVFAHVRRLRMDYASELLKTGSSVTAAAYALGYEHPQHFSTAYRKFTGIRPRCCAMPLP